MKTDFAIIIIGVALFAVVWVGWQRLQALRDVRSGTEPVFCTADAKLCPDGSYVGRVPPHCAFAACP